jgi:FkbM family methyltransferase
MKAFIILAPENSGSRMLTRYMVETGCIGETGFTQKFDTELPAPESNIVWKTHNVGTVVGTVEIKSAITKAIKAGYEPVVLLLFRDPHALASGQVQRGFQTDFSEALALAYSWYVDAFAILKKQKIPWHILSYESMLSYNQDYLKMILSGYELVHPTSFYISDQNQKYFRSTQMKLLPVIKSGIPFYVREGTVDVNVLDEVITGDCYKLSQITLRQSPNIIDVGAHIGGFTKLCAWNWPHGRIFSFEANPRNWDLLESNVSDIREKVSLFKGALVGHEPVNKRLVVNALEADRVTGGWGIIYADEAYTPGLGEAFEEIERFYYIKDILPALDKVDILKLDCEGSEWSILDQMTDEELSKVDYLVAEIHCGALAHAPATYEKIRAKILKHFICPELTARETCRSTDLFNIIACNRKLLPE